MTTFLDLLLDRRLPINQEAIREVHADCVSRRHSLGDMVSTFREAANAYRGAVAEILTGNSTLDEKKARLQELRTSVFERASKSLYDSPGWINRLQSNPNDKVAAEVVGTYFQLFTDMGFFNGAIQLYEKIPAAAVDLKMDPDVMLGLANAYNYRTQQSPDGRYISDPDPAKALGVALSLEGHFHSGGEWPYVTQYLLPKIAGIKARAEILLADKKAEELGGSGPEADAARQEGLKKALKLHKDSFTFEKGYHHYSGYNAMLLAARLGDLPQAKDIAPKMYLSAMRDNGIFANDPLTVFRTTMAMVIEPKVLNLPDGTATNNSVKNALANLQTKVVEPWQKHAFLRDAQKLAEAMKGDSAEEKRIRQLLEESVIPALKGEKRFKSTYIGAEDPRRVLLDYYSYSTAANAIIPGAGSGKGVVLGGNLSKGGLIPDLNIASEVDYFAIAPLVNVPLERLEKTLHCDAPIFPEKMRRKTLSQLALENKIGGDNKTGDFYDAIRLLVREIFHTRTRNMENMGSHGHDQEFEKPLRNLYAIAGLSHEDLSGLNPKDRPGDKDIYAKCPTGANASHLMAMRLGDCRMYKVMSGLFHRIASAAAQNELIQQLEKNDLPLKEVLNKARDVRRVQLVNFDLDLFSNVEAPPKGWPERNEKGYFVKNTTGDMVLVEPHSVNLLVERKPSGEIENLFLACTFYNGEYRNDKDGTIVPGATYDLRVPITRDMVKVKDSGAGKKPEIEIDLSGKTGFKIWDPATQKAVEPDSLVVRSSKYSHANFMEYGPTNTRKLYTGNPSTFLSAPMPRGMDLEKAWEMRMDTRALLIANEVDNIRQGLPPAAIPAAAKGTALDSDKRAVGA
jgi:hypothetical protein